MRLVIFGLSITSSWGNGHATLWRGLCRALGAMGHHVTFFERDVPYYAAHRDLACLDNGEICLFDDWADARPRAERALDGADAAIVTSYCADAVPATELLVRSAVPLRVFYDLDTPVTLARLEQGASVPYIGPNLLHDFDLVLSYTGGRALDEPLYGSVDPDTHRPASAVPYYRADLSYLGTYAADRQHALEQLFIEPARTLPDRRFLIGGAQYPGEFPWLSNIYFVQHVEPASHPAFYCSSALTLNVTRGAMAEMGWCPSGRLFEAAACGAPLVSDWWDGLDTFFEPGREVLVARTTDDVVDALRLGPADLQRIAQQARERVLDEHTATHRAAELIDLLEHVDGRADGAAATTNTGEVR